MKSKTYILIAAVLLLVGCQQQKYAYLENAPRHMKMPITTTYATTIFPGDVLYIYVYSQTPETAAPFNEETNRTDYTRQLQTYTNAKAFQPRGHLVGSDGSIVFPLLGTLSTTEKTADSLAHEIEQRLMDGHYVADPIVTVSLMNFRVTVIGEVANPQQLHADGNRMTIFEAIAQCGDVTMDGKRDQVVVVRSHGGKETVDTVNLTSRTVLESPYYYLQQNDIVYVVPTKKKQRTAYRNEEWVQYFSTGMEAIRFAYTTVYQWFINPTTRRFFE
ncbi:MAG: polysaccharide biosynthesis/export family protein [Bacteroidales bacterium]|nr:polysaccharide biosynthesis/export family protein [Bacteroidales bacterium]